MSLHSSQDHARLITKLESIADLSDDDRQRLRGLPLPVKSLPAHREVLREGDRATQCCLLLDGLMHRYKTLPKGERQVLCYHLPGDIPDLQTIHLETLDHSLGTVGPVRVAFISHSLLRHVMASSPALATAFWRDTLIDASVFREWIVNVGARDALQRIAHLLCELFTRMTVLGLAKGDGFTLPLVQAEIGNATGITAVHVNRSLQELRGRALIASEGRFLRILDWVGLQRVCSFDPAYLHLKPARDA